VEDEGKIAKVWEAVCEYKKAVNVLAIALVLE